MAIVSGIPEYITAICPPEEIVAKVRQLKERLYARIEWFGSYNAEAHITFEPFDDTEAGLEKRYAQLQAFAAKQPAVDLTFDAIDFFAESHTIFLAPDKESTKKLRHLNREYTGIFPVSGIPKTFHPHMTIGRALKPEQFEAAKKFFADEQVNFSFHCDNIALRKYNGRQYDIVKRFYFTAPVALGLF